MKYVLLLLFPIAVIAAAGCELSSIDPGGGYASATTVTMPAGEEETIDCDTPGCKDCGPGCEDEAKPKGAPGVLVGQILFDGAAPAPKAKIPVALIKADPAICSKGGDIPDESLVVDSATGGIANVFIYLAKKPKWKFTMPEEGISIDQKFCVFKPHALIALAGDFQLKNSDQAGHNIKGEPKRNASFNVNLPAGGSDKVKLNRPEPEPFQSTCAIHAWMDFWTLVVDHPYATVTNEKGEFRIPDLPAGDHEFRVWQEKGGMLERKLVVTIKPDQDNTYTLKYTADKFGL
ncbi:MAG: hypothetical protein H8E37_00190 [Planctomycetes bacterium]|nr:hypothetical protein [Planctomycetota bacterium]